MCVAAGLVALLGVGIAMRRKRTSVVAVNSADDELGVVTKATMEEQL
jgi:hypothetical protein